MTGPLLQGRVYSLLSFFKTSPTFYEKKQSKVNLSKVWSVESVEFLDIIIIGSGKLALNWIEFELDLAKFFNV